MPSRCVGCGLCQTRCHGINVDEKSLLGHTAIEVFAGPGNEDRIRSGSYIARHVGAHTDLDVVETAPGEDEVNYVHMCGNYFAGNEADPH